jgi:hypothetical protein
LVTPGTFSPLGVNFVAFLATMALKSRLVVFVDVISEDSKDVAFEGKVLFHYENWDPNLGGFTLCILGIPRASKRSFDPLYTFYVSCYFLEHSFLFKFLMFVLL